MIKKIGNKEYIARSDIKKLIKKLGVLQRKKNKKSIKLYHKSGNDDEGWQRSFTLGGQSDSLNWSVLELENLIKK